MATASVCNLRLRGIFVGAKLELSVEMVSQTKRENDSTRWMHVVRRRGGEANWALIWTSVHVRQKPTMYEMTPLMGFRGPSLLSTPPTVREMKKTAPRCVCKMKFTCQLAVGRLEDWTSKRGFLYWKYHVSPAIKSSCCPVHQCITRRQSFNRPSQAPKVYVSVLDAECTHDLDKCVTSHAMRPFD